MVEGKPVPSRKYLVPLVEDIMTANPIIAMVGEDAITAASRLVERRIGSLPVVGEGERLKEIITT